MILYTDVKRLKIIDPVTRVADGGFVCTSISTSKHFKNQLIADHCITH